jgi:hypothetical protein
MKILSTESIEASGRETLRMPSSVQKFSISIVLSYFQKVKLRKRIKILIMYSVSMWAVSVVQVKLLYLK